MVSCQIPFSLKRSNAAQVSIDGEWSSIEDAAAFLHQIFSEESHLNLWRPAGYYVAHLL